jgi:hypothetical protein
VFITFACIAFGALYWQQGNINRMYVNHHFDQYDTTYLLVIFFLIYLLLIKLFGGRNDEQGIFNILGCMFGTALFAGINNCQLVMPFVSIERSVVYRERFAGMYSPWAYSLAQVNIDLVQTTYIRRLVN